MMKPNPYILEVLTSALTNHLPLSQLQLPEEGDEREAVDREVQDLAIEVFSRIMAVAGERGIEELVPAIRARLAELFEMDECYFERLPAEKEEILVNEGRIFVPLAGGQLLRKIRLAVERAFIARCHNVHQQKRVIRLVSGLLGPHLSAMGREHSDLVFGLAPALLDALQKSVQAPKTDRESQTRLDQLNLDWDDIEWTPGDR